MAEDLGDLLLLHLQVGSQFGPRRAPAQLAFETAPGLGHLGEQLAGMDREPHGAPAVGDTAGDGLADPPGGVGGELEPLAPVELLDRVHHAQVAFLDQVQQGQLGGLVLLGDGHHQAQVGRDEGRRRLVAGPDQAAQLPLAGRGHPFGSGQLGPGLPAGLGGLGQPGLVVLGQQRTLTDVVQVEADQVLLGLSGLLIGHSSSSFDVLGLILPAGAVGPGSRTANSARQTPQNTLINPKS